MAHVAALRGLRGGAVPAGAGALAAAGAPGLRAAARPLAGGGRSARGGSGGSAASPGGMGLAAAAALAGLLLVAVQGTRPDALEAQTTLRAAMARSQAMEQALKGVDPDARALVGRDRRGRGGPAAPARGTRFRARRSERMGERPEPPGAALERAGGSLVGAGGRAHDARRLRRSLTGRSRTMRRQDWKLVGLTLTMLAAVAVAAAAQERPAPAPRPTPEPRERAFTFSFDGDGGRALATVRRGRLGVLVDLTPDAGRDSVGARIAGVTPGGPADRAGVRTDDIVLRLNGTRLVGAAAGSARREAEGEQSAPGLRLIEVASRLDAGRHRAARPAPRQPAVDADVPGRRVRRGRDGAPVRRRDDVGDAAAAAWPPGADAAHRRP